MFCMINPLIRSCGRPPARSIFTLPDLSPLSLLSKSQGQPDNIYHDRKIFPYTRSQLYGVVADVASYPRFVPFCTGSRIVASEQSQDKGSVIMNAELTVGFLSFEESYMSKVTCKPYESVEAVASSSTPLFKTLVTTWRFQPLEAHHSASHLLRSECQASLPLETAPAVDPYAGSTLVTLDLAFSFANPVHAAVSAAFFGQVSKLMVKAFGDRCLDVYGPGHQ